MIGLKFDHRRREGMADERGVMSNRSTILMMLVLAAAIFVAKVLGAGPARVY